MKIRDRVSIYALCEPSGGVRYVGKSIDPQNRFWDHLCDKSKTHRGCWIRALLKAGERPLLVILEVVGTDRWEAAERRWIAYYRQCGTNLVNATDGGDGVTQTPEIIKKISDWHRGRKRGGQALENIRAAALKHKLGTKHSEATKAKMRASHRGRPPVSEETKRKISEAKRGVPLSLSAEQRAKITATQCGRKHSEATRKKMSESHLGKKKSAETRRNMVEAWKLRRAAKCASATG